MRQEYPIKCTHGDHKICKHCSRYKMVILLKNGCDDMKDTDPSGKKVNPVRYSYVSKNRKPVETVIAGMLHRFQNNVLMKFTNVIHFYENEPGGQLVAEKRF
ncbi:MAG: hypothetical protein Q8O62_09975 [Aequorivita sp.]|nr:hypothetical protein [Aequorivita sp.]